ncbi:helix-turn-helix domain-containing protein [Planctomycetota bacterium]
MANRSFYKLPARVAERRDLKPSDKVVFAVVIDRIGDNSSCWPGVRTIAQDSGLTTTTVTKSVRRLEAAELLLPDRRGPGKSTHYRVVESALETNTVEKRKRVRNYDSSVLESSTEAREKVTQNQTDTLNQTTTRTSFAFVLRSGKHWYLPQGKFDDYIGTYPNLDVDAELRKAAQWLIDNADRRKTAAGMRRFLGGWLKRAKPKPEPKRGDPDWLPTEEEAEALMQEVQA